jgi:Fic family protein
VSVSATDSSQPYRAQGCQHNTNQGLDLLWMDAEEETMSDDTNNLMQRIALLKRQFDELRPSKTEQLPPDLQRTYDIELTYTSNAIEGNTLTLGETADLIEHGITVGGKSLKDHMEVVDHYDTVQWMRSMASGTAPLDENVITEMHRRIVARSRPEIAGVYSQYARRVVGSPMVFPNPMKIPALMEKLGKDLSRSDNRPATAFDMHYRLVTIHPFDDGNGRTARLLMNLMLIRSGYVPVPVRPEDRQEYRESLKKAQLEQNKAAPGFQAFMHLRLESVLQQYVNDLGQGRKGSAQRTPEEEKTDADEKSLKEDRLTPARRTFLASRGVER